MGLERKVAENLRWAKARLDGAQKCQQEVETGDG